MSAAMCDRLLACLFAAGILWVIVQLWAGIRSFADGIFLSYDV